MTRTVSIIKVYESFVLGVCQCPCSTEIDIFSPKSKGRRVGYLRRYKDKTHALKARNQTGENNSQWKGGEPTQDKDGYWLIYSPDHPYKNSRNKVFLHRLLYEDYLSIIFDEQVYLPQGSEIHHINKDKEDNSLINLQFMPNVIEHRKEHRRNYDGIFCSICGTYETSKKENGQPHWYGNDTSGWKCLSCHKKEYYIKNKEQIRKRKKERYKLTKKK